jgi:hypothetical protein
VPYARGGLATVENIASLPAPQPIRSRPGLRAPRPLGGPRGGGP